MQPIRTFKVSPSLPTRLEPLRTLAYNLHWDWNTETRDLFHRLDPALWESTHHNPVLMLGSISQTRLYEVAEDEGFLAQMDRASRQLEAYLQERSWYSKHRHAPANPRTSNPPKDCIAYFSAEFGLTECLPVYSGGLGVLAGDHLKSASDLGLPLVGVGLLYQEGYFAQYLTPDGWQQEQYPINDFYNMPLHLERHPDGSEIRIGIDCPGRTVYARIWRIQIGTVPLYLMDTNIEPNNPYDHDITDKLYGGDIDMRMHQEMLLGIGGVRMLRALGLQPTAYHMNEGHSAFLSLERIRILMEEEGLNFTDAKQIVQASQMFTTHTPVPAGFDLFDADRVMHHLGSYAHKLGLSREEFLSLGRENTGDLSAPFNMATLAIKTASFINGVSQLHGEVSRSLFRNHWPELPLSEIPITSITNGVHARSCVSKFTQELYDRYLGPSWSSAGMDHPLWERIETIPDEELWRNHERCRSELVVFARDRLCHSLAERGASPVEIAEVREALDPFVLTIGFARRFATYKRATLFLRDVERLQRLLHAKGRRVQFIIAGKAHPKDVPGKELIRDIIKFIHDEGLRHSMIFIPNYDIQVSRLLVAGCDVWLNTPRRPREASGTSGMKAAMNGVLNLSVLDGWWAEADYANSGWPIGRGEVYTDPDYQDEVEANALYELLEREVVPTFYDRDGEGLPRRWIAKMKQAIRLNCPHFNTARMVAEYAQRAYFPLSDRFGTMTADHYAPAQELAQWKARIFEQWYNIQIEHVDIAAPEEIKVNEPIAVKARINLAGLSADDVQVELYQGVINDAGDIVNGVPVTMTYQGTDDQHHSLYTAEVSYHRSGLQGLSLRVLPRHQYLTTPHEMGLIRWA